MAENRAPFDQLARHDHQKCLAQALGRAERICRERGLRLTPLRRQVLELVWSSHRPVGAYQLLEQLPHAGRAAPPTVYRALDFLQQMGLVHRLASINAYIGCPHPEQPHHGPFLICTGCQTLVELNGAGVAAAIAECTAASGFDVSGQVVEIHGLCPHCR